MTPGSPPGSPSSGSENLYDGAAGEPCLPNAFVCSGSSSYANEFAQLPFPVKLSLIPNRAIAQVTYLSQHRVRAIRELINRRASFGRNQQFYVAINFYYWWEAKGLARPSALVYVERHLTVCCGEKGSA